MEDLELVLQYPPSVNSYYGRMRNGQVYIKEKGREYRKHIVNTVKTNTYTKINRLRVKISLQPPDLRRRDLDNILKCLLDALTHAGVYEDDSQIDELIVLRKPKIKGGLCTVNISVINN